MKLLHCYVENFGKLHKFSYTFPDSLCIIEGENGWGKSTLAVFIKAMLYGLPASRSSDLLDNERKRYAPWNGERFGGSLSILVGDKSYRIERIFGKKESDDIFKLFSIDTGLPSDDYSSDIGQKIFGIDEQGYERSTYFSQRPLGAESGYGSIQSRLSEQEDLTLSERAFRLLDKRRKYYQMTGNRGKIAELDLAIAEQSRRLEEAERETARLEDIQKQCKDCSLAIESAEEKRKLLGLEAERALKQKSRRLLADSAARLKASRDRAKEARDTLIREIGDVIPSEEEVESLLTEAPEIDRLREQEEKSRQRKQKKKRLARRVQASALSILAGLSLVSLLIPLYPLFILSLVALVSLTAIVLTGPIRRKKQGSEPSQGRRLRELLKKREDLLAPLTPILSDPTLSDDQTRLTVLREKRTALTSAEAELTRAENELSTFLDEHPEAIEPKEQEYESLGDPSALLVESDRLNLEIDRMRGDLHTLTYTERQIAEAVESIPAHAAMLRRLSDERGEAAKNLAAILRTVELLESARSSLITRYRDVVEASFIRYVDELSESVGTSFSEEARSFTVSGEFDLSIAEGGVTRSPILYSTGYRDLFALCLRFALTDALFTEESAPMILDDPFVNLDDKKLCSAMRLLDRLSTGRQIVYFTCSSSRVPGKSAKND